MVTSTESVDSTVYTVNFLCTLEVRELRTCSTPIPASISNFQTKYMYVTMYKLIGVRCVVESLPWASMMHQLVQTSLQRNDIHIIFYTFFFSSYFQF